MMAVDKSRRNIMNKITCCLVLAAVTMLMPAAAGAQGSVTIFGSVADGSGAAVPGARITATSGQTGSERVAVSDTSGNYAISALPVGTYTVKAELAGFRTFVQEQIHVQVDENRRVNVVLEVGPVAESVTVAGEQAQVDTRTGTLREVVDSQR